MFEKTRAAMYVDGTLETLEPEDFGTLTDIPAQGLNGCLCSYIYMPNTIKSIGTNVLYSNQATIYVKCSPSVSKIPNKWWGIILSAISNKTVLDCTDYTYVPELDMGDSTADKASISFNTVKVPSNLLTQWKSKSKWSDIADKIVAG